MKNALAAAIPATNTIPSVSGETDYGANPAPTRAPLASRSASPGGYATSGMERAMGAHADKEHPVKGR